jgi:hypothetical protein
MPGGAAKKPVAKKVTRTEKTEVVYIVSYSGKNLVWPPVVVLDGGDTVRFRAVNTDATIFIEDALSFEGMTERSELFKVPKKHVLDVKVKPEVIATEPPDGMTAEGTQALAGIYPYSVFCSEGREFAEGNSTPVMLIEPPEDDPRRGGGG